MILARFVIVSIFLSIVPAASFLSYYHASNKLNSESTSIKNSSRSCLTKSSNSIYIFIKITYRPLLQKMIAMWGDGCVNEKKTLVRVETGWQEVAGVYGKSVFPRKLFCK